MPRSKKTPVPTGPGICRLCPRWENTKTVCMSGSSGTHNPELVIVTAGPAPEDDAAGLPVFSATGRVLVRALADAGLREANVHFTHMVRCYGGLTTFGMVQIRKCRSYLLDELGAINYSNCRGVLLVGETAIRGVLNNGKLSTREARLRVLDQWGPDNADNTAKLIPVPLRATVEVPDSITKYTQYDYDELVGDIQTTFRIRDPIKPVTVTADMPSVSTLFDKTDMLSIDLEWRRDGKIRMVGLSDGQTNCVIFEEDKALTWINKWTGSKIEPSS